jgi:hypothetical protein
LRVPFELAWPAALSVLALLRPLWAWVKGLPARGWPTIQGTVGTPVVTAQHGLIASYRAHAAYTYILNGDYYSGFFEKTFLRKHSAEAFAAALRGQMAFVHYDPAMPGRSVLLEREQYGWQVYDRPRG